MIHDREPDVTDGDPTDRLSSYTTTPHRMLEVLEDARQTCPVAHSSEFDGFHILMGYDDVKEAVRNHRSYASGPTIMRPVIPRPPLEPVELDPPEHTKWRHLFSRAVTPSKINALEPSMRADITRHIDGFIERGEADLVRELCQPAPVEIICKLMGVDDEFIPEVWETSVALRAANSSAEEYERAEARFAEATLKEVNNRRREPRDDYLTLLTQTEVDGRPLDDATLVRMFVGFLGAGHDSTTVAMASLAVDIFSAGGMRDHLLSHPADIPKVVDESLRLHPPFYGVYRRATEDSEVAGIGIPAGGDVYLSWAAANRDPEAFPDPTTIRLDRKCRHLTFGFGLHACPGAALARLELRVMAEELLRRVPDMEVMIAAPEYRFSGAEHAYMVELPVKFTPGRVERP